MKVKFNLSREFKKIPEGEQVLTITDVVAKPKDAPKEITIEYTSSEGLKLLDRCDFNKTLWKLSRLCQVVFNINDGDEMELDEIVKNLKGTQIKCEIVHTKGTQPREDGTYPTFVNINKILSVVEVTEDDLPKAISQPKNPRDEILSGL